MATQHYDRQPEKEKTPELSGVFFVPKFGRA